MRLQNPSRRVMRYLIAVAASCVAIALVAGTEPVLGFIPLLLLPAVVLVERYLGPGPAIVATAMCTGVSFFFFNAPPIVDRSSHNLAELALFPLIAAIVIRVMETRRKEKRAAQEQLLELSTLLESMPEAVLIFDPSGHVVDCNRAAEALCDLSREQLLGSSYIELARRLTALKDEKPIRAQDTAVARVLRGEAVRNESRDLLHPRDNTLIHAVVSASPMRGERGRMLGALLVVRDVTEITQLQRRVADTERHLAIGQMASGIAHDFNNVLNTITQAVALLELRCDETIGSQKKYLDMIDRAARTGAEIIKRLREYIRGGSGRPSPVDVSQLMEESLELTRPMWRKIGGLTVEADLKPVPLVRANAADLQRAFTNLIINAIQAMPNGGCLRLASEDRDGNVFVSISDTGHGISPEQQKRIFLPYYTTKPQGTGLGLSTAQKIVLSEGGNISFSSEPGKGTTFNIQLPAMQVEERVKAA
ncbi:MAG: nitrogen regulation protein NR(II) [Terriglobales bacterium]